MFKHTRGKIAIIVPLTILTLGVPWYVNSTLTTQAKILENNRASEPAPNLVVAPKTRSGNYVLINLDTNTLLAKNGTSTLKIMTLVSQGKPGSYYETIGGEYTSSFKELTHFSSMGHVFMPYSVHIFGNYFIHGIPYYPDGTKVSSAFSGGCVRLEDKDAEYIYNFVTENTPIIITRGDENSFAPTKTNTVTKKYTDMTRIMVAIVSLEALPQDEEILLAYGVITTRKELLSKLLSKQDFDTRTLYSDSMETQDFVNAMNTKAKALGLTSTIFLDANSPIVTTEEDYLRFMDYVRVYKSFLLQY